MPKSPDAFRTISEVADWLGVQAHVLRFWESKFSQVKPIKRAGGRRYYRPADMLLLGGIKKLLHDDGLTIKGVQKILREQGMSHVADQSQALDDLTMAVIEGNVSDAAAEPAAPSPDPDPAPPDASADDTSPPDDVSTAAEDVLPPVEAADVLAEPSEVGALDDGNAAADIDGTVEEVAGSDDAEAPQDPEPQLSMEDSPEPDVVASEPEAIPEADIDLTPELPDAADEDVTIDAAAEAPEEADTQSDADTGAAPETAASPETDEVPETAVAEENQALPSFLRHPLTDPVPEAEPEPTDPAPEPEPTDTAPAAPDMAVDADGATDIPPKPRVIDLPPLPAEEDMPAQPSALSALARMNALAPEQRDAAKPLLAQLIRLRTSMAKPRKDVRKD
ncbi:MerR family transcriptional regulator [Roseobacter sp. YSTF-M11]|uniref:MerR family transcriptional regulator n=1 Tax=Roseobacter insulae TaxID=2859783 RepID=A0A9X1FUB9_9RHOB|nr:MerR family transcriptional regulator [Roseobacter insulae]MBW4708050.1 MerR family transcriptional regulator [Roseobacter insulae]